MVPGALLVTGAAGTGKSSVLRERFARLVEGGADPERVALIVGSRRARQAARDALIARLPASLSSLHVLTFHGLGHLILRERFSALGYAEPPEVLSAADQFALVQDLLQGQDPAEWPAYGHLLDAARVRRPDPAVPPRARRRRGSRPRRSTAKAESRGLSGWNELARFYREYLDVLDADRVVDFAALIGRAEAAAAASASRSSTICSSTTTTTPRSRRRRSCRSLRTERPRRRRRTRRRTSSRSRAPPPSRPLRFTQVFAGASHVELTTPHRAPRSVRVDAWIAAHTSEEYAAVARELRRLHVDDGVAWGELAVVIRRQGSHVGGLLRALDDARRAADRSRERRLARAGAGHAAVRPRAAVARRVRGRAERLDRIRPHVGPGPSLARGGAWPHARSRTPDGSRGAGARVHGRSHRGRRPRTWKTCARSSSGPRRPRTGRCSTRSRSCGGSCPARADWSRRPTRPSMSRRELDSVVGLLERGRGGRLRRRPVGRGVPRVGGCRRARAGFSAWERREADAVQVLTAHGAVGREFHTVIVVGAVEGNFPSLSRPEPMFDLEALDRLVSQSDRNRARLEDERRLFRMVARPGAGTRRADGEPGARGRGVHRLAVRRRARA